MPTIQSASPRLRAASSRGFIAAPARKESKPSRIASWVREGDPEPENRLAATRETVQIGEDELSLSPRVAGVSNFLHRRPHQTSYHLNCSRVLWFTRP